QRSIGPRQFHGAFFHPFIEFRVRPAYCFLHFAAIAEIAGGKDDSSNIRVMHLIVGNDFEWQPLSGAVSKPEDGRNAFTAFTQRLSVFITPSGTVFRMNKIKNVMPNDVRCGYPKNALCLRADELHYTL